MSFLHETVLVPDKNGGSFKKMDEYLCLATLERYISETKHASEERARIGLRDYYESALSVGVASKTPRYSWSV